MGIQGRIAAQIVTGIGFLGEDESSRNRNRAIGLSHDRAATVWVNAALGVAAGAGDYHLAVIGGAVTLAVLLILDPIERGIERRLGRRRPPID